MNSITPPRARRRFGAALAAVIASAALVLTACSGSPDANPSEDEGPRTLTVAVGAAANTLDPSRGAGVGAGFQLPVYGTLFHDAGIGNDPAPSMAESYEWIGEGSQTLKVTLPEGAVFSDGTTPFDSAAVKTSIEYFAQGNGGFSNLAVPIASIDTPDERTVVFNLSTSVPTFVSDLTEGPGMGSIVNPTVLADDPESLSTRPAGAGPYVLSETGTVDGSEYHYVPNEHYFDQDGITYDEIVIKVIADPNTALAALQSGQVDVSYGSPDAYQRATDSGLGAENFPGTMACLCINDWNGAVVPALADARVRQAINFAIDREAIAEAATVGLGEAVVQVPPVGSLGYDAELDEAYTYDPERAKELLEDAGYGDGFVLPIIVPGTIPTASTIGQAVAAQLAEIGIDMQVTIATTAVEFIQGAREPGKWGGLVFIASYNQGMPSAMRYLFGVPSTTNNQNIALPDVVEPAAAASALSGEEAQEAWAGVNETIVEQAYTVPITTTPTLFFYGAAVSSVGTSYILNPVYITPAS